VEAAHLRSPGLPASCTQDLRSDLGTRSTRFLPWKSGVVGIAQRTIPATRTTPPSTTWHLLLAQRTIPATRTPPTSTTWHLLLAQRTIHATRTPPTSTTWHLLLAQRGKPRTRTPPASTTYGICLAQSLPAAGRIVMAAPNLPWVDRTHPKKVCSCPARSATIPPHWISSASHHPELGGGPCVANHDLSSRTSTRGV
jgi:hypothetical protein